MGYYIIIEGNNMFHLVGLLPLIYNTLHFDGHLK